MLISSTSKFKIKLKVQNTLLKWMQNFKSLDISDKPGKIYKNIRLIFCIHYCIKSIQFERLHEMKVFFTLLCFIQQRSVSLIYLNDMSSGWAFSITSLPLQPFLLHTFNICFQT